MKNLMCSGIALVMVLLLGINILLAVEYYMSTDEDIMNQYIIKEYGEEYYGELLHTHCDDDEIAFRVYDVNDNHRYTTFINRDYYCNLFSRLE